MPTANVHEEPHTAFALVKRDDAMFAPLLTRREASNLKAKLHEAMMAIGSAFTYENEPQGWFSELAWLEALAWRQSQN